MAARHGIAVVGVAAQLPSGDFSADDIDYTNFWNFLINKGEAYEVISATRINPNPFKDSGITATIPKRAAFLKRISELDHVAFGISARDARVMPYGTRRLIEVSFLSLLDSGIRTQGQRIGCFMSGNIDIEDQANLDSEGSFTYFTSSMANRISYMLDITGPSMYIDTACSSSMTSLHLAINAIEKGDCTAALVGASQSNRKLSDWRNYLQSGVLSPDGISKPFSDAADGFARSEGAVTIVIKNLEAALHDNDHIYSVIVGSAINSTGSHMPLNVPSGPPAMAQRSPSDVDYAELHVTGTSVGDPIETNAAGEIFGTSREIVVGSVKGNLGHLEAVSCLASLLKSCLIFEKGIIPPNVNMGNLNPAIYWGKYHLHLPSEPIPLVCHSSSGKSIISVSSAGIGGATGHVVLEAPPVPEVVLRPFTMSPEVPVLFLIGGLTPRAVETIVKDVNADSMSSRLDTATTHSRRARQFNWGTFFTHPLTPGKEIPKPVLIRRAPFPPPLAFVFGGQGPQHFEMGRQLFLTCSTFRNSVKELDEVYQQVTGISLIQTTGLFSGGTQIGNLPSTHWPVAITLPALCMVHIALFDLLGSVGIKPQLLIGHSAGETAIVYASGAGSKAMALEIAIARGRAMTVTEQVDGGMAAVACNAEQASDIIKEIKVERQLEGVLGIACYNAPDSVTLSGTSTLLDEAVSLAKLRGYFAARIRTIVPGHSSYMDMCQEHYNALMVDIFSRYNGSHKPQIPVFSTCTSDPLVDRFTPEYFWANARNPVAFSQGLTNLLNFQSVMPVFIEISPHPALSPSIHAHGVPADFVVCPMRRASSKDAGPSQWAELTWFSETLGNLFMLGVDTLDLTGLYGYPKHDVVSPYPFIHRTIPVNKTYLPSTRSHHTSSSLSLPLKINYKTHPTLAEHVINLEPIFPATAYLELLLQTGAVFLWDVEFKLFMSLMTENPISVELERTGRTQWSVKSSSIGRSDDVKDPREHACGCMDFSSPRTTHLSLDLEAMWKRLQPLDLGGFYESLEPLASYGVHFQRLIRCHGGPSESLAEIKGLSDEELAEGYVLHPVLLDSCLHAILHRGISQEYGKGVYWLPSRVEQFMIDSRDTHVGNWYAYIILQKWTPDSRAYNVSVINSSGARICEFVNLTFRRHLLELTGIQRRFHTIYQPLNISSLNPSPPSHFTRVNKKEAQELFKVLDSMVLEMSSAALEERIIVGDTIDRQRYLECLQSAQLRKLPEFCASNFKDLQSRWPEYFEVTNRIKNVQRSIIESSMNAVGALYSDDLMYRFYSRKNLLGRTCEEAARVFSSILSSIRASGKRSIKILEVGAGTGLMTGYLVDILQDSDQDLVIQYTATDSSYAMANDLARSSPYYRLFPKELDLKRDPSSQGFSSGDYDVLIAHHVLHVVPDIKKSLSMLRPLLVPGGTLLAVELNGSSWADTPGSIWHDCIFGSFSEWFSFIDDRKHCGMSPIQWTSMLGDIGFHNIHTCVEEGGGIDFLFTAQTPFGLAPVNNDYHFLSGPDEGIVFIPYHCGQEIELQSHLRKFDSQHKLSLYLIAMNGPDASAATGLILTLARELESWMASLAIFEDETDYNNHREIILQASSIFAKGDSIVFFPRNAPPRVPRVVPLVTGDTFKNESTHTPPKYVDPDHLTIKVSASEGLSFVGKIVESYDPNYVTGLSVIGITTMHRKSPILTVHKGFVAALPNSHDYSDLTPTRHGLGILLGCLSLGTSRVTLPNCSHPPLRILIAIQDSILTKSLVYFFTNFATSVHASTDYRGVEASHHVDVVISDVMTIGQYPHLHRYLHRKGKLIVWDSLIKDYMQEDPWAIRCALEAGLNLIESRPPSGDSIVFPSDPYQTTSEISTVGRPLFFNDKMYLLIGGIGGIGVHLAVWMYQNGARNIILTSRRGISSLDPIKDGLTLKKLAYLNSLDDLVLRLESCDATSAQKTAALIRSITIPIGGCFLMTLALSDSLFMKQSRQGFESMRNSKVEALKTITHQVDISSFDFFIALSSVSGLLGNVGQANYASACTEHEDVLKAYPNAFSFISPGISDVGYIARSTTDHHIALQDWSMTADELCACIGDGIRVLYGGAEPLSRYIPDLKWSIIEKTMKLSASCRNLLCYEDPTFIANPRSSSVNGLSNDEALRTILNLLDVSKDDFDAQLPLTAYGLDSISAARLSTALRPYGAVSQMQLLGGLTWNDIQTKLIPPESPTLISADKVPTSVTSLKDAETAALGIILASLSLLNEDLSPEVPLVDYGLDSLTAARLSRDLRPYATVTQMQLLGRTSWSQIQDSIRNHYSEPITLNGPQNGTPIIAPSAVLSLTETIVDLCKSSSPDAIPLIILHELTGSITSLLPLQDYFSPNSSPFPIWAIQTTPSTPFDSSFQTLVSYYHAAIKQRRPQGPYRLASFSASSVFVVGIARMLEAEGELVLSVEFIDHFPALWIRAGGGEYGELRFPTKCVSELRGKNGNSMKQLMDKIVGEGVKAVVGMLRRDPFTATRHVRGGGVTLAGDVEAAYVGAEGASEKSKNAVRVFAALTEMIIKFLAEFQEDSPLTTGGLVLPEADASASAAVDPSLSFIQPFLTWIASVKAPMRVFMATDGIVGSLRTAEGWDDLGAARVGVLRSAIQGEGGSIEVVRIQAGHFGIMGDLGLARMLGARI